MYTTVKERKLKLSKMLVVLLYCSIRMEFLEHLEEWKIQAMDRANSVVAAKVDISICNIVHLHIDVSTT